MTYTGLVHQAVCQFIFDLLWYSLCLPTEGWPGWVDLIGQLHTEVVSLAVDGWITHLYTCMQHKIRMTRSNYMSAETIGLWCVILQLRSFTVVFARVCMSYSTLQYVWLCKCGCLDPEEHPQTEEYWGRVNPNGPTACHDEGKRIAETLSYAYEKQVFLFCVSFVIVKCGNLFVCKKLSNKLSTLCRWEHWTLLPVLVTYIAKLMLSLQ